MLFRVLIGVKIGIVDSRKMVEKITCKILETLQGIYTHVRSHVKTCETLCYWEF